MAKNSYHQGFNRHIVGNLCPNLLVLYYIFMETAFRLQKPMKNIEWILKECVTKVPNDLRTSSYLLELGLSLTQSETDMEVSSDILAYRNHVRLLLLHFHDILNDYEVRIFPLFMIPACRSRHFYHRNGSDVTQKIKLSSTRKFLKKYGKSHCWSWQLILQGYKIINLFCLFIDLHSVGFSFSDWEIRSSKKFNFSSLCGTGSSLVSFLNTTQTKTYVSLHCVYFFRLTILDNIAESCDVMEFLPMLPSVDAEG